MAGVPARLLVAGSRALAPVPPAPSKSSLIFAALLTPLRKAAWVVYAKNPFGGPQALLAYWARHTHRVAIANSRLISADESGVAFNWKD